MYCYTPYARVNIPSSSELKLYVILVVSDRETWSEKIFKVPAEKDMLVVGGSSACHIPLNRVPYDFVLFLYILRF